MQLSKNNNFNLFSNEGFLFENKFKPFSLTGILFETKRVMLTQEGPKPAVISQDPFHEGIDEPEKGKEGPKKPEGERKKEAQEQVTAATKAKLEREYQAIRKQQEKMLDGFVKMANGQKMTPDEQTTINNYFKNIKNYEYTDIRINKDDNPVQLTVSKSQDGKYFRVNMLVKEDSKGYEPNIIGKGNKEWVHFFNAKGEPITGKDEGLNNAKFPFKEKIIPNKGKEVFDVTKPEGKLANSLRNIESKDMAQFQRESANITALINQLKPDNGKLTRLPGGYVISNLKPDDPSKPDIIVFKDGKAVCYMLNNNLSLPAASKEFAKDRHAEIVSAQYTLDQAFKEIKWNGKKWNISPKTFENIKISLKNFSKFVSDEYQRDYANRTKPTLTFRLPESHASVAYWRVGPENGSFKISLSNGGTLGFNTLAPDNVFFQNKDGTWAKQGAEKGKFVLNEKERAEEKSKETEAKRVADEKNVREQTKAEYEQKITEAEKTARQDYEKAERTDNLKSLFKSDFQKHLKSSPDKLYDVTVDFQGQNPREKRSLEYKTKIHDFFNIPSLQKVIEVTVKHKGLDTKGMYYPGQDTVYIMKLDNKTKTLKQTKDRVKIFNGDTMTINMREPKKKDYEILNNKEYKQTPDNINQKINLAERYKLLDKFLNLNGTINDLDAKEVDKLKKISKIDKYKESFLKKDRDLSQPIPETGKQNILLKAENVLLKNAVIRLEAKSRVDNPPAKPAATPPAKPAKPVK